MAKYASWQTPELRAGLQDFSSRLLGLAQRQVLPAGRTRGSLMAAALPEALKASRGATLRERERKKYDLEMEALERKAELDEANLKTRAQLANYFKTGGTPPIQLTREREELIPAAETPYPRVATYTETGFEPGAPLGGVPDVIGPIDLQAQAAMTSPSRTVPATYMRFGEGTVDPALRALQAQLDPEEALKNMIAQQSETPSIETDVHGVKRYTTGYRAGEKVFDVPPKMMTPAGQSAQDLQQAIDYYGSANHPIVNQIKKNIDRDARDIKSEGSMSERFTKRAGPFLMIRDAYYRVAVLAKDATGASDMGLIFNIMKMFDPGSVVRESEFATASTAGSVPSRVRGYYNRIVSGKRLDPKMRRAFADVALRLMVEQTRAHVYLEDQYTGLAERAYMEPKNVVLDYINDKQLRDAVDKTPRASVIDLMDKLNKDVANKLDRGLTAEERMNQTFYIQNTVSAQSKASLGAKYKIP